jgi:hypothetical protein
LAPVLFIRESRYISEIAEVRRLLDELPDLAASQSESERAVLRDHVGIRAYDPLAASERTKGAIRVPD